MIATRFAPIGTPYLWSDRNPRMGSRMEGAGSGARDQQGRARRIRQMLSGQHSRPPLVPTELGVLSATSTGFSSRCGRPYAKRSRSTSEMDIRWPFGAKDPCSGFRLKRSGWNWLRCSPNGSGGIELLQAAADRGIVQRQRNETVHRLG